MWQTAIAIGVGVLAVGGFIWYKLKSASDALSVDALKDAQISRDAEKQKALEAALAAKANEDKEALKNESQKVLAIEDEAARTRAALELLASIRGKL